MTPLGPPHLGLMLALLLPIAATIGAAVDVIRCAADDPPAFCGE